MQTPEDQWWILVGFEALLTQVLAMIETSKASRIFQDFWNGIGMDEQPISGFEGHWETEISKKNKNM